MAYIYSGLQSIGCNFLGPAGPLSGTNEVLIKGMEPEKDWMAMMMDLS